jgi:hypothetical protein
MRSLVRLLFALLVAAASPGTLLAQDASPDAGGPSKLSQLGLPEVRVTATADGLQIPGDVPAGTVLFVLDNQSEGFAGISLIQLPEGTTMEEAMVVLGGPPPAEEGSPVADGEASPAAGEGGGEMGPPPPLFYEMTWAGGVFAPPGMSGEFVVTLTPGEWVLATDPESGMAPVTFQVTGEAAEAQQIEADATVEMDDFEFVLPDNLTAGSQIWSVTNSGEQPHEMFVSRTPRRLTLEEVQILLELPEDQLPPEGVPSPAEFQDVGGVAPISTDQTVLVELNLEPGAYVAVCFMPDRESGMPHALKGMVVVFEIPEEGQTVEPPSSPVAEEGHDMATPSS